MHVHHQSHAEQRRRQVDDGDRDKSRDQRAGGEDRSRIVFSHQLGLRGRAKAHRRQLEILLAEQPCGHNEEDKEPGAGKEHVLSWNIETGHGTRIAGAEVYPFFAVNPNGKDMVVAVPFGIATPIYFFLDGAIDKDTLPPSAAGCQCFRQQTSREAARDSLCSKFEWLLRWYWW